MPLPTLQQNLPEGNHTLTLKNSSLEQSGRGERLVLYWEKAGSKSVTQSWIPTDNMKRLMEESIVKLDLGELYPAKPSKSIEGLFSQIHDLVQAYREKGADEIKRKVKIITNSRGYPEFKL
jgi:hypothetical protein